MGDGSTVSPEAAPNAETSPEPRVSAAGPAPGPARPTPSRGPRRGSVPALAVWAVAATVAAGLFAAAWAPLRAQERDRQAVRAAAADVVVRLTTFDGATLQSWIDETRRLSTGRYADQVEALFDQQLRDELRARRAVSRGEVVDVFVQEIEGDGATALVIASQTIDNDALDQPLVDRLHLDLALERVDGRWLASDLAVLRPGAGPEPGD